MQWMPAGCCHCPSITASGNDPKVSHPYAQAHSLMQQSLVHCHWSSKASLDEWAWFWATRVGAHRHGAALSHKEGLHIPLPGQSPLSQAEELAFRVSFPPVPHWLHSYTHYVAAAQLVELVVYMSPALHNVSHHCSMQVTCHAVAAAAAAAVKSTVHLKIVLWVQRVSLVIEKLGGEYSNPASWHIDACWGGTLLQQQQLAVVFGQIRVL